MSIATSQKTTCARPNFAAIPTQVDPTTQRTCARTRSPRPSSLRKEEESSLTVQQSWHNGQQGDRDGSPRIGGALWRCKGGRLTGRDATEAPHYGTGEAETRHPFYWPAFQMMGNGY